MKSHGCCLFLLFLGVQGLMWGSEPSNAKALRAQKILETLDGKIYEFTKTLNVPGVAIGVVVGGEVIYSKAFGKRNVIDDLPMTTKTVMPIGSATKSFTSFLIGQLVDEGVLHWEDPIAEHIPKFKLIDPHTTYQVTIRDYLAHISGYSRHDGIWYGGNFSRDDIIKRLRYLEPFCSFREQFYYGNLGYMIAAHAAECSTGKSWEKLVQEYILDPLEMKDTTASIAKLQTNEDHSFGYRPSQMGLIRTPFLDPYTIAAAGGLNSNVEDLVKWVKILLNKGKGFVQSQTFKEMTRPQVISNVLLNGRYDVEDFINAEAYGLGWFVVSYRHHEAIFHGGNIEGFSSSVFCFPKEDIGIVVLSNKHFTPLPYFITCEIADSLLGLTPIDWVEKSNQFTEYETHSYYEQSEVHKADKIHGTTPSHKMNEFVGIYDHPAYGSIEFKLENSRLLATFNGLKLFLDHWHYDTFEVSKENNIPDLEGLKANFSNNFYGDVDSVIIPFEPVVNPIHFKRRKDEKLFKNDYLERFLGNYSYLGFSFVVEKQNSQLTVKALGQPPFILIPEKEGLFSVVDYDGYIVQFLIDDDDVVSAVQLIQPNNTTYTAYKVLQSIEKATE